MEGNSSSPVTPTPSMEELQLPELKEKAVKFKRADQEVIKCLGVKGTEEMILKSYSCAWQKDILVHGRLHLTQNWICFYSNILGWETKTCVGWKDVTAVTKQRTALVFPNAILLEACNKKYGFTSFVHRDRAYLVMQFLWDNALLSTPCAGEALKHQLSELYGRHHRHSKGSKSLSLAEEGSDIDVVCLSVPRETHSTTPTPTSDFSEGSEEMTAPEDHVDSVCVLNPGNFSSCSESGGESILESDRSSSSIVRVTSSDNNVDSSSSESSPPSLEQRNHSQSKDFSESTIPLTRGGSPNFLHHWKQTLNGRALLHSAASTRFYNLLWRVCSSPTRIINTFIILFILLLLISTMSMVCRLSEVEPALQPYLCLQPWCPYTRLKNFDLFTIDPN